MSPHLINRVGVGLLILLVMLFVFCFSVYLAIEAMKLGMCQRKWFIAAMCFGPVVWPMFNVKRQMHLRKLESGKGGSLRF